MVEFLLVVIDAVIFMSLVAAIASLVCKIERED